MYPSADLKILRTTNLKTSVDTFSQTGHGLIPQVNLTMPWLQNKTQS